MSCNMYDRKATEILSTMPSPKETSGRTASALNVSDGPISKRVYVDRLAGYQALALH